MGAIDGDRVKEEEEEYEEDYEEEEESNSSDSFVSARNSNNNNGNGNVAEEDDASIKTASEELASHLAAQMIKDTNERLSTTLPPVQADRVNSVTATTINNNHNINSSKNSSRKQSKSESSHAAGGAAHRLVKVEFDYDSSGTNPDEMSVKSGWILQLVSDEDPEWWLLQKIPGQDYGSSSSKQQQMDGFVPKSFVAILPDHEAEQQQQQTRGRSQFLPPIAPSSPGQSSNNNRKSKASSDATTRNSTLIKTARPSSAVVHSMKQHQRSSPGKIARSVSMVEGGNAGMEENNNQQQQLLTPSTPIRAASNSSPTKSARASSTARAASPSLLKRPASVFQTINEPLRRRRANSLTVNTGIPSDPIANVIRSPVANASKRATTHTGQGQAAYFQPPPPPLMDDKVAIKGYEEVLRPRVAESGLGLVDLMLEHEEDRVMMIPSPAQLIFTVHEAKHVPTGFYPLSSEISSNRYLRIGIFLQHAVKSNIHSLPCLSFEEKYQKWSFSNRTLASSMMSLSPAKEAIIARISPLEVSTPCILFELCVRGSNPNRKVLYSKGGVDVREEKESEYCCAWGLLPILTAEGRIIEPKGYEVKLYAGSAANMDLLPLQMDRFKSENWFAQLFGFSSNQPKLIIKVNRLGINLENQINCLPWNIIANYEALPLIVMYRQLLANFLLKDQEEPIRITCYQPVLQQLPAVLSDIVLLHSMAESWQKLLTTEFTRQQKKSMPFLIKEFHKLGLKYLPLLQIQMLQDKNHPLNERFLLEREKILQNYLLQGPISILSKNGPRFQFKPLDVETEYGFTGFPIHTASH